MVKNGCFSIYSLFEVVGFFLKEYCAYSLVRMTMMLRILFIFRSVKSILDLFCENVQEYGVGNTGIVNVSVEILKVPSGQIRSA
jgi:hypothetical protein